ncbi:hypothetical protein IQ238_25830 [Pleurocapsales cyanobacterium LEGE 06147]|nr:hypothetical protein [Pleurocapsales cyanobacterium LEGE 06147]
MAVNDRSKQLETLGLLIILFLLNHAYFYSLLARYVRVDRKMHSSLGNFRDKLPGNNSINPCGAAAPATQDRFC